MFCYCYYVHYAMITTKIYFIFISTLLSLHNCHENKTTTQLSWEKNSSIFSIRKFSVSKRFIHDTVVSPSGTSVESYMLYYTNIHRKTPVLESLFNSEYCEFLRAPILKNIYELLLLKMCSWNRKIKNCS